MFTARKVGLFIMALLLCVGCGSMVAVGNDDHHVNVKIDRRVNIVPGSNTRAMMGMVRNPIDGTIYLNTQYQGLYKSTDNGLSWAASPVTFTDVPVAERPTQRVHGLGVSSTGRLYLLHQRGGTGELYISTLAHGDDSETDWDTTAVDWANMNLPGTDPYSGGYNSDADQDYNSFVELSDGTMMTAIELLYPEAQDYLGSPTKAGLHETVIRSTDNGATWGTPTSMHQFVAETSLAINPNDSTNILAMTRIQRGLLPGEDQATVMALSGCPNPDWTDTQAYKNGILLESNDSGNTFHEVTGGLGGYYEFRGTALWTPNDTVVIAHQDGYSGGGMTGEVFARISLDSGKTWVDGTKTGTSMFNLSKKFQLVPSPPGHSFTTPTVEISRNNYLTTYAHLDAAGKLAISGVFWHIEPASGN